MFIVEKGWFASNHTRFIEDFRQTVGKLTGDLPEPEDFGLVSGIYKHATDEQIKKLYDLRKDNKDNIFVTLVVFKGQRLCDPYIPQSVQRFIDTMISVFEDGLLKDDFF